MRRLRSNSRARQLALATLLAVLVLGACAEGSGNDPTGRTWQLATLGGSPLLDGTIVDLTIDGDTVSGNAGCNTYTGPATVGGDGSMTLGPDFAVTFMACEQPVMDQEQEYLNTLSRVTSYQMAAAELLLEDANGVVVATFE
jgi:heat shock protein HslJ